jgi:hypothetical protein
MDTENAASFPTGLSPHAAECYRKHRTIEVVFMIRFVTGSIGWLLPILLIALLLNELVAVVAGMLLLVTLSWRDLLGSTEAQLQLLIALGVMTLGVFQFVLISFLTGFSSPEEYPEEEVEGPVWVLPPSAFFTPREKRRRRPRSK